MWKLISIISTIILLYCCCWNQEGHAAESGLRCATTLNSNQFALLCRVPDGPDSVLNYLSPSKKGFVNLTLLAGLSGSALQKLGKVTANQICDGDCRCIHGALKGGGRCMNPPGTTGENKYCICEYEKKQKNLSPSTFGDCKIFGQLPKLCTTPLSGVFLDNFCNEDCVCSHGYPEGKNHCRKDTLGTDGKPYCLCNNGTNIPGQTLATNPKKKKGGKKGKKNKG